MKKLLSVFLMLTFVFALSACSADVVAIEDYEWKMRTVMSNNIEVAQNEDQFVVAVGEADELYPDCGLNLLYHDKLLLTFSKEGAILISTNKGGLFVWNKNIFQNG